jgi:hypothetical protein
MSTATEKIHDGYFEIQWVDEKGLVNGYPQKSRFHNLQEAIDQIAEEKKPNAKRSDENNEYWAKQKYRIVWVERRDQLVYDDLIPQSETTEERQQLLDQIAKREDLDSSFQYDELTTERLREITATDMSEPEKAISVAIQIFPDAKAWLIENLPDMFVDGVAAVYPITTFNPNGLTTYRDEEEETEKECTLDDHVQALQLLVEQVGKTLFVGSLTSPLQLTDAGNWDIEVVDAYYQLVYRGEVIYG